MKVIASSLRKGNILELDDGKLYVVSVPKTFIPARARRPPKSTCAGSAMA